MPVLKHLKKKTESSFARVTPFLSGVVYRLSHVGFSYSQICDEVEKPDGGRICKHTIGNIFQACERSGGMTLDGTSPQSKGGRPRDSTSDLDKKILAWSSSAVTVPR